MFCTVDQVQRIFLRHSYQYRMLFPLLLVLRHRLLIYCNKQAKGFYTLSEVLYYPHTFPIILLILPICLCHRTNSQDNKQHNYRRYILPFPIQLYLQVCSGNNTGCQNFQPYQVLICHLSVHTDSNAP